MKRRKIPRKAVEALMETCKMMSEHEGKSPTELFKSYLELMDKYAEFFFSEPWSKKADKQFEFGDEEAEFIERAETFEEEAERFTLVCLRRNMSMEGFDQEGFREDFDFYGGMECWDCPVREAVELRREVERKEQFRKEIEEKMKHEEPSWVAREMYEHLRKPDVIREHKMLLVELRLYEELGGAEGKSCKVKNKYRCPYGEESEQLIRDGRPLKALWQHIEWYDYHWNPSHTFRPSVQDMKWYHYGEPGIIDVTSYEDILKALENGRMKKVIKEHKRYMKEIGREA